MLSIVAMFIIVNLIKKLHTQFAGMLIIYLHGEFNIPGSNGPISHGCSEWKLHEILLAAAMLFYILQNYYLDKSCVLFWKHITIHRIRILYY